MKLLGIGSLFAGGLGVAPLEAALENGWQPPKASAAGETACQVDLDSLPDRTLLKKLRRADKLSKMAVLAAAAALDDSGIAPAGTRVGIILATAFGAHVTTFDFLDGIIDYGEASVSPTAFSNSVHNAAASYIATTLGLRGPTLTVTAFRFSFEEALQLADAWLAQGRADYFLVGAVEQYGAVLGHVTAKRTTPPPDGRLRPFSFDPAYNLPGEGALFFLVAAAGSGYCRIEAQTGRSPSDRLQGADLAVINSDGMQQEEQRYLPLLPAGLPIAAYAPLFGSIMTGSAFNLAAAALMLKRQKLYAVPEQSNPHGLNIVTTSVAAQLSTICSCNLNCNGETAVVRLHQE